MDWSPTVVCPRCNNANVRIIDKGLKRFARLFMGSSRYYCAACKTTWRLNKPSSAVRSSRRRGLLPCYDENGGKVIRFPDDNWQKNVEDLLKTIESLFATECRRIVLDLSLARSINSASIGSILKAYKLCKQAGCDFRIARLSPEIHDAFRSTSLEFIVRESE